MEIRVNILGKVDYKVAERRSDKDMTMRNISHEAFHVLSSINDACDLERMYNGRNEHQAYLMGWICDCINKARLGVGDFIEIEDKEK